MTKMSAFPAMQAFVTPVRHNRTVYVSIQHDPGQSYSRAVTPRAKKEFKAWVSENIMFGELELVKSSFASVSVLGRCISVFTFTY
jgi:hypothetical protein